MGRLTDTAAFDFGGPANYRVVILGTVSEDWSRRLGGMEVTASSPESDEPRTTLEGRLPDQAALRGLLETLYALHLPILEVCRVDDRDKDTAEELVSVRHQTSEGRERS